MKIIVMTLGGKKFKIEVNPEDKVADLKRTIESVMGVAFYPSARQMLIHRGNFLENDTTVEENEIAENSSVAIMLSRVSSTGESTASTAPSSQSASTSSPAQSEVSEVFQAPYSGGQRTNPAAEAQQGAPTGSPNPNPLDLIPKGIPAQARISHVILALPSAGQRTNPAAQAQQPAEGAPTCCPDTKPINLFPQGIPAQADISQVVQRAAQAQQPVEGAPTGGPNTKPLNLFPLDSLNQNLPANYSASVARDPLDFLRDDPHFDIMRAMVRANPPMLPHMLEALGKRNQQSLRLIQRHQAGFLRFINETSVGDSYILGLSADGTPQYVTVTTEQQQAIQRLEAMGFDRIRVVEAFFACDMNEELAANYLLDHMHEF